MPPSTELKTYAFNCRDHAAMEAFLAEQRTDGVFFTRGRLFWFLFWQRDFTVHAEAWRMPRLRRQIDELRGA